MSDTRRKFTDYSLCFCFVMLCESQEYGGLGQRNKCRGITEASKIQQAAQD